MDITALDLKFLQSCRCLLVCIDLEDDLTFEIFFTSLIFLFTACIIKDHFFLIMSRIDSACEVSNVPKRCQNHFRSLQYAFDPLILLNSHCIFSLWLMLLNLLFLLVPLVPSGFRVSLADGLLSLIMVRRVLNGEVGLELLKKILFIWR